MRYALALSLCVAVLCVMGCPRPSDHGPTVVQEQPAPPPPPPPFTMSLCADGLPIKGFWKCAPALVDLNDDGNADLLAVARLGNGPHVWLGDGGGHWTESSAGLAFGHESCGGGVDVIDVNGDDLLDLVIADHCKGVFVYLNSGDGSWEQTTAGLYPDELVPGESKAPMYVGAENIAAGDVNGDSYVDLVVSASDQGGINVYLGDGTGRNWAWVETILPTRDWARRLLLRDLTRNGYLDIIATCGSGPRVWHNDGKGNWTPASEGLASPHYGGIYTGLGVGDLNEDGLPDLAVANWVDGPEVYLQQADGTWKQTVNPFPEINGGAVGLDVGDLDGDGHLDIVCSGRLEYEGAGYCRGVFALHGDGKGGFRYVPNSGLPTTGLAFTWGITVGDINGDGLADVAAGSGLLVESTSQGPTEPSIPQRLLVWCTSPGS